MKTSLFFCLSLLAGGLSFAQDAFDGSIRWGEEIIVKKKTIGPDPVGSTGGRFYATKYEGGDMFLQEYAMPSLQLSQEDEVILEYEGNDLDMEYSMVFNERVLFISSYRLKKEEKLVYIMHEIAGGTITNVTQLVEVTDEKHDRFIVTTHSEKESAFMIEVAEDKQSLMVLFRDESKTLDEARSMPLQTILFDKNLEEVKRGSLEMDTFLLNDFRLANNGLIYMVGFEPLIGETQGIIKRETVSNGDPYLLTYDGSEVKRTKLGFSRTMRSVALKPMDDGSVIIYGMFSNEGVKGVSGAFYMKLDENGQEVYTSLEEFDENFVTQFWSDKQKEKAEKKNEKLREKGKEEIEPAFYNYVMHDLVMKENGDMVLLAEQYYMYVTSHTTTDANGNSRTTYTYHYIYNDIIAVNCTQKGDITWKTAIHKNQHSTNDGGYLSSFFAMAEGDQLHLIYNDNEANMNAEEMENASKADQKKAKRKVVAAIIHLDSDGGMKREKLYEFDEEEARILVPKRCEKMSANEIFLFTHSSRKGRILGWVTL